MLPDDDTTTGRSLAERMYNVEPTPKLPADPSFTELLSGKPDPSRAAARAAYLKELEAEGKPHPFAVSAFGDGYSPTIAERMYPEDGTPPEGGNYAPALHQAFEDLHQVARDTKDVAGTKALHEGQQQAQAALREFGVGATAAKEISRAFSRYQREPLPDNAVDGANALCEAELRKVWRDEATFQRNLRYARMAYAEACKRMPWFHQAQDCGGGTDPSVIRHMATIGKRIEAAARKKR